MTTLNRWLLVLVVLVLAWRGLAVFVAYWVTQEQRRMQTKRGLAFSDEGELIQTPPKAAGLRQDSRKVGR